MELLQVPVHQFRRLEDQRSQGHQVHQPLQGRTREMVSLSNEFRVSLDTHLDDQRTFGIMRYVELSCLAISSSRTMLTQQQAKASGVTVNSTPKAGAIAQTDAGTYGHVAWVKSVSGSKVTVEEFNYANKEKYGTRTVAASTFKYIHL
jgi:CHAP domain